MPLSRLLSLALVLFVLPARAASQGSEVYPLKKLILAGSVEGVAAIPGEAGGDSVVYAHDVPLFAKAEFAKAISPFLGRPISVELAKELIPVIAGFARSHDMVVTPTLPPTQDITRGALRFAVVFGRYQDISFRGNRWFSRKILEERLGIKPGDEIRLSTLEEAVTWVNTNPFRSVKVVIDEVPSSPGKANLIVGVMEHRPFRAAFSADDAGNEFIGKYHFGASLQFGNLWGRDHQGSYQLITTEKPERLQSHALDYRVPLASRNFVQINASHTRSAPVIATNLIDAQGRDSTVDLRYTIPLRSGESPREAFFGVNFKRSDNSLLFDGELVRQTATDAFHLLAGFTSVSRSKRGAWMWGATLFGSPGNITSRNTDAAFSGSFDFRDGVLRTARSGAQSFYGYGNIVVQRLQPLSGGWDLFARGIAQFSTHNLIPSEQLTIGGAGTVRGYRNGIFSGEDGFILNHDLMSPVWRRKLPFLRKASGPLETRFVGFLDIGKVKYHESFSSDIRLGTLASTGLGFRSNLGSNFSASFDYGWQLMHLPRQPGQANRAPLANRAHLKLVLAF